MRSSLEKREFYSQASVSQTYDELRFGSASGAWVNEREMALVDSLLPATGRVLDLASGTGRGSYHLSQRGYSVFAVDYSDDMVRRTVERARVEGVRGDAFALPFADGVFDSVVALRFVFHFPTIGDLLTDMRRVVAPGGYLVFDTYCWTPRALIPLFPNTWGGRVFIHPPSQVRLVASQLGLRVIEAKASFLFSPYLYRILPLGIVRLLGRLEGRVPEKLFARVFWKLRKS